MSDTLDVVEDVRRLRLKKDDALVVRCKKSLSAENHEHITSTMTKAFPNHRILVLDCYMDLEVLDSEGIA